MQSDVTIRPEEPADSAAVFAVHRAAFALPAYVQAAIASDGPAKAKPTPKAAARPAKARGARKG